MPKCEELCEAIQSHNNPSPCPYHRCLRSWSWSVLWRPRKSPRTNTQTHTHKDGLFITGDWNAKVGSQEISGVTGKVGLWEQNEAQQELTEFCMRTHWSWQIPFFNSTRDAFTHGHHQIVNTKIKLNILCSQRWRNCIQSAKTIPGADCGSDHQLLSKIQLKLKKAGKAMKPWSQPGTTGNQIPYEYSVEVMNRFKRLDLVDKVPEEIWTEVCNVVQEAANNTIPNKKKSKKSKWLSEAALQTAKGRSEKQVRKGKVYPTKCRFPKNSMER